MNLDGSASGGRRYARNGHRLGARVPPVVSAISLNAKPFVDIIVQNFCAV